MDDIRRYGEVLCSKVLIDIVKARWRKSGQYLNQRCESARCEGGRCKRESCESGISESESYRNE